MVIQNSEVSMASKTSVASGMKLTIQSATKPVVNLENVQVLGSGDDFLSSLNYARSPSGNVQEVGESTSLVNAAANRRVRYQTMEYLFRLLIMDFWWGNDSKFSDALKDTMADSDISGTENLGNSYTGLESVFVQSTNINYSYWQEQSVEYTSTGTVVTGDGRKINFDYSFAMSDSFVEEFNMEHIAIRNCVDPLVINLDDCPTSISNQKFFFDLNADGEEEEIHNLGKGSGFLALDKNEDGVINDGSELFGALTGNGFAELAAYDEDGNGWIDEADSIFSRLRIMTVNENGEQEMYGLKQSDVGAIFLGRLDTEFIHRDEEHNPSAVVRKSGVFLHEKDGHAGGVQHVDFTS